QRGFIEDDDAFRMGRSLDLAIGRVKGVGGMRVGSPEGKHADEAQRTKDTSTKVIQTAHCRCHEIKEMKWNTSSGHDQMIMITIIRRCLDGSPVFSPWRSLMAAVRHARHGVIRRPCVVSYRVRWQGWPSRYAGPSQGCRAGW